MKTVWKIGNSFTILNVGRNEECPCGSKMKFKYCCIDTVQRPILRCKVGAKIRVHSLWEKIQYSMRNKPKQKVPPPQELPDKYSVQKILEKSKQSRYTGNEEDATNP